MASKETAVLVAVALGPDLDIPQLLLLINGTPIPITPATARILAESLSRCAAQVEYEQQLIAQMRAMSTEVPTDEQLQGDEIAAVIGAVRTRIFSERGKIQTVYVGSPGRKVHTG